MIGDAMRSAHAPKACITDEVCITHAVRITFRKERITQKSLFRPVDKRDFFVGAREETCLHFFAGKMLRLTEAGSVRKNQGIHQCAHWFMHSPPGCADMIQVSLILILDEKI